MACIHTCIEYGNNYGTIRTYKIPCFRCVDIVVVGDLPTKNPNGIAPRCRRRVGQILIRFLARLTIQNFPDYYHYYSEKEFVWSDIRQGNRNPLLYKAIGADGLKTGHTEEAGYCLVASAKRGDMRLIAVVALGIIVVVGVLQPRTATAAIGGSLAAQDFSQDVYIPISTLWSRIGDQIFTRRAGTFEGEMLELSQVTLRIDGDARQGEVLTADTSGL